MISRLVVLSLLGLIILLRFQGRERIEADGFEIRFGLIAADAAGYYDVAVETNIIPLIHQQVGFYWGYAIQPPDEAPYTTREVLFLPAPPRHIDFPLPIETEAGGRIIRTPSIIRQNYMVHFYHFSEGDPLGDWKIQIKINDLITRTIRFQVVRPLSKHSS